MAARRALVTGAAGFIGCHLTERLVSVEGWDVRAVDNERSGDWSRIEVPVERVHADLAQLDTAALVGLCRDVDVLFHLAAEKHNSAPTPQKVIDLNVSATRRLFEGAARAEVGSVVFTSSLYAYGSMGPEPMRETDVPAPDTVYGISKVAGEHLLREAGRAYGLSWSAARMFFVYGPKQHAEGAYKSVIATNFERLLRGARPTIYGDGTQALDYLYVDDVVEALVKLADPRYDGCLLNLCTGHAVSISDLTGLMLRVSGSELEPFFCPPDWTAGSQRVGSPELAQAVLGWTATTPLEVGLEEVWRRLSGADLTPSAPPRRTESLETTEWR
jgi:UDP-glucose 4-epimerase